MNQADLTPISVATVLASTIFAPAVADIVGPYSVILLAAMAGVAVALMQRPASTRANAMLFFAGSTLIALLLAVPLAMALSSVYPSLKEHWLFAPMAMALGYAGDRWGAIFKWCMTKVNAIVDALIQARTKE